MILRICLNFLRKIFIVEAEKLCAAGPDFAGKEPRASLFHKVKKKMLTLFELALLKL